jgi:hypothetical protein
MYVNLQEYGRRGVRRQVKERRRSADASRDTAAA